MSAGRHAASQPTLTTVADAAGVSRQTVSNALNNPELLRPDTLARVQEVIERLGYTPNRAARQLRTRNSHLIGLRFEQAQEGTSNALMDRFLHSLVETMERTDHHVLLFSGDPEDPLDGYDDLLRSTAVDAFVVTDTYAGTPQAAFLQDRGAPFVAFGRPWAGTGVDEGADWAWVDVDGAAGARMATEHLLAAGHDKVAWLGWEKASRIGEDRRAGWAAALTATGRDPAGLAVRTSDNVDAARMASHALLEDRSVSAVACASDTLAIGVLHALAERGLRAGTDVGVVGFDDSLGAQVSWPGLSSVRQPLEQVAVELVALLHRVLSGEPLAETDKGTMLTPSLVVRRSSQR
ncbi:LacI family DNA-binding transcriptional regulator [Nocardioides terrisoli]|uniref:LacI family DNA-binding transcriptional regulator n=1 Tax=Nocardioides terrisoli TaxID=3388267 RepID=UPI00287B6F3C|nr:LacI family DNA-binding transcriptional regulator [Nocardioides marmorisolisilvae]